MPWHSVKTHRMPVEARGVSVVARGVSLEYGGNNHEMPCGPMGTAAVLRQKTSNVYIYRVDQQKQRGSKSHAAPYRYQYMAQ